MTAAVYGEPVDGVDVVPISSPALASLLAAVHRRVLGTNAATSADGEVHLVASEPATDAELLDAHVVEAIAAAERVTVLAGPGVVTAGAVPGLHALAAAGRFGVLNTWGAKGVFDWRSRHHLATAGLQALDFELAGLPDADLVIATGIDVDEAPPARWASVPHVTVDPRQLDALSEEVSQRAEWQPVPELRTRLAAVTQGGWADDSAPAAPSAITRTYGDLLGTGGRLGADGGVGGFWVARTFSTVELGTAHVPSRRTPGFAAAVALVTRLAQPQRPVLAVVDEIDDATGALMAIADDLGAGFAVEVWSADGDALAPAAHRARLERLTTIDRCEVVTLGTAEWQLERIVAAAGEVVAWGGIR